MPTKKQENLPPYVNASTEVATAKTKTFSPISMKLITYGLYKLAYSFDISKYKDVNLLNKKNWTSDSWDDFTCSFSTKEFCDALGIVDGGKQRVLIEAAIDKAFEEKIKLRNENQTRWFPWFVEAFYYHPTSSNLDTEIGESDDKSITFTFHPGVLAIALNQTEGYAHIDLQSYGKLKSTYSLKWYQIIKARYNMKGKWGNAQNQWTTEDMTIPELRDLFGISPELYADRTNNLLQKVLRNPVKEINEAGFDFHAEIIYRRGKNNKVESFRLLCTETESESQKILPDEVSAEEKKAAEEADKLEAEVNMMKMKYPDEWAECRKSVEAKSQMPLFSMFVDQEILSMMKKKGFSV